MCAVCAPVIPFSSAHLTSAAAYFVWRHKKRDRRRRNSIAECLRRCQTVFNCRPKVCNEKYSCRDTQQAAAERQQHGTTSQCCQTQPPVSPPPTLSLALALLGCPVQVNRRFVLSAFCLLNKMTFISSCIQNCYVAGVDVGSRRQHLK